MVCINLVLLIIFSLNVFATDTDNLVALVQIFRHGQRTPIHLYPNDPYKTHWKDEELKQLTNVFRHGQRTPILSYPTNPYTDPDTYWGGLASGQLTNVGKRQLYALGQFTRRRYSGWLPTAYSNKDIYVQTTDVDRTHMSAQAYLYGLYTATGNQVWRRRVDWQPIPIHPSDPMIINSGPASCPFFTNLQYNITSEEEFLSLDETYSTMYEYISNNTNSLFNSFLGALPIYDAVHIQEQVGFSLPSWLSAIYPEPISSLAAKGFQISSSNTQKQRFVTGVFLNTILEYFEKMVEDPASSQKFQVYSCHDSNVFAILNTLGQTPTKPVPFATSIWFELRNVDFVNVVQLWMRSGDTFTQLSIKGCDLNCPLTEVKILLKDILLDVNTYIAECNGST